MRDDVDRIWPDRDERRRRQAADVSRVPVLGPTFEELQNALVAALEGYPVGVSWWRCRWCFRIDVDPYRTVVQEQAECLAHEASCGRRLTR